MATETDDKTKFKLAPPAPKKPTKAPEARLWPLRWRELPREWKVAVEDFGFTKSSLHRYAESAKRGDKNAIAKLEPLRQFYLTIMGMTQEPKGRIVRHEEGEAVGKPVTEQRGTTNVNGVEKPNYEIVREERSAFAIRESDRNVLNAEARKPRVAENYWKVYEHFYDLCALLEFVRTTRPAKFFGMNHPDPEGFSKAHKLLIGGGTPNAKTFAGAKEKLAEEFRKVIEATEDPVRRDVLEMLLPYLTEGKQSEWTGEN